METIDHLVEICAEVENQLRANTEESKIEAHKNIRLLVETARMLNEKAVEIDHTRRAS